VIKPSFPKERTKENFLTLLKIPQNLQSTLKYKGKSPPISLMETIGGKSFKKCLKTYISDKFIGKSKFRLKKTIKSIRKKA